MSNIGSVFDPSMAPTGLSITKIGRKKENFIVKFNHIRNGGLYVYLG
jgi:hypothetical protein